MTELGIAVKVTDGLQDFARRSQFRAFVPDADATSTNADEDASPTPGIAFGTEIPSAYAPSGTIASIVPRNRAANQKERIIERAT